MADRQRAQAPDKTTAPDGGAAPASSAPPAASEATAPGGPGRYEYVGDGERVYTHVPVTVRPGDVVELPGDPRDGRWKPTTRKVTRQPDNAPPTAPASAPADHESEHS